MITYGFYEKKNFYIEGIPTPCLPTMAFREIYSVLYRLESIHFDYQSPWQNKNQAGHPDGCPA